jgi:hypothetical protein
MIRTPLIASVVPPSHVPFPSQPLKKQYPRVHRIVLDSKDADGDYEDCIFKANLPQNIQSEHAMLFVESFYMTNSTANADLETEPYKIHIRGLTQPLSYHTENQTSSDVVLTLKGRSYSGNLTDGFGISLLDKRFFNNSSVNVYFTSPDSIIENSMDADYILTLLILELGD